MFNQTKSLFYRLLVEEDGPTAVEYAVMLAMIIIAAIGAVLTAGDVQQELFFELADEIESTRQP